MFDASGSAQRAGQKLSSVSVSREGPAARPRAASAPLGLGYERENGGTDVDSYRAARDPLLRLRTDAEAAQREFELPASRGRFNWVFD